MTVLVTGANGFVGTALYRKLLSERVHVRAAVRLPIKLPEPVQTMVLGDIHANTEWSEALEGISKVVHLAARVHVMVEQSVNPLAEFRSVNVEGTINLARQAVTAGVTRFVFLSSVKVNGESTQQGHSFAADDLPAPEDAYGISKYEAEQALKEVAEQTGMEVVIIRSPLVYGPGVKANFERLMHWLDRGLPLPFGMIQENRRSLVALDNLVDLVETCLRHPAAANQTFLVSDGEDLSTAELLRRMGQFLRKPARLFAVPPEVLRFGAALVNKEEIYQRLCGSLQVDIGKTRQLLNWQPPVTIDEGLRRAAEGLRR